jgi:hypothetical protein
VFRYHVVLLWQLDARAMLGQLGLRGAPFCVAMHGADEALVRGAVAEVRGGGGGLTEDEQQTTMQLLYIMTAAILGSGTARRIFHMESLIQDPNVQELIREWESEGLARGVAQGLAQGKAEGMAQGRAEGMVTGRDTGRAEEARTLLYKVLAVRAFAVTPDVRARIDGELEVARLEAWLEAAVIAGALGDVFRSG